jgi:hypothetical protein
MFEKTFLYPLSWLSMPLLGIFLIMLRAMVIDQGVVLPPKAIEKAKIKGQGARTT